MAYENIKGIFRKVRFATAVYSREFSYAGFSLNEAFILSIIARYPDIIAKDIRSYISVDSGYLSRVLKKLDDESYIERKRNFASPHEKKIRLTRKGLKTYSDMQMFIDECIERYLSGLDDDKRSVLADGIENAVKLFDIIIPDDQSAGSNVSGER